MSETRSVVDSGGSVPGSSDSVSGVGLSISFDRDSETGSISSCRSCETVKQVMDSLGEVELRLGDLESLGGGSLFRLQVLISDREVVGGGTIVLPSDKNLIICLNSLFVSSSSSHPPDTPAPLPILTSLSRASSLPEVL